MPCCPDCNCIVLCSIDSRLPGTAVRDSVSLDTFSKLLLRHLLTVFTHHATDSDPLAPPIHF